MENKNQCNSSTIKIDDININYILEGKTSEIAIVFIHGLSDDLNYWLPLSTNLKDKYTIIRYDLRGHGNSNYGNKKEVSIDLYQDDLYKLLKNLKINKVILIGLSLGGNIALNFANKHPGMTKGLILLSTFSAMNPKLETVFNLFENKIKKSYEDFYENILPYCISKELIEKHKDSLNYIKAEKAKTADINGILGGIKAGYKFNLTKELSKINIPTLIIAGENDPITTIEMQKEIHKNIKNSKMIIFPNTYHNILIGQNIKKVNDIIEEYLKENQEN